MTESLPTIAIIGGTGKEGTGLAFRWAYAGYKIIIGSRQLEKAHKAAEAINQQLQIATTIGLENKAAVKLGDICVLTVIPAAHQQIIRSLKNDLEGKILVDATSRVDYHDPKPPEPPPAAFESQNLLGTSVRVVAAFQSIPARLLTIGINYPLDADVLVCSDDIDAAEQVIQLARAAGMRGYYAGALTNAIVIEGLTSVLISLNKYYKVKDASIKISGVSNT